MNQDTRNCLANIIVQNLDQDIAYVHPLQIPSALFELCSNGMSHSVISGSYMYPFVKFKVFLWYFDSVIGMWPMEALYSR